MWRHDRDDRDDPFVPIAAEPDLAAWLDREGPTLLFLNDPYCPISGRAFREISRLPGPIGLLDVDAAPHLSALVEARTGIRHESPQVILFGNGQPVWSASHFRVTEGRVREAMAAAHPDATEPSAANS